MAKSDNDLPDDEFQKEYSKPEPVPAQEEQEPKPEIKEPEYAPPPDYPPPLPYTPEVSPLTDQEILEVRWIVWGKCPECDQYVRNWSPGVFHPVRYSEWTKKGIHILSGHMEWCTDKRKQEVK